MADMYSGGSTSAIASSAPERGKGGSADAISMSAAEVTRRLAAWISPHGRFLVLAAASSIATVVLQLWVPIIVGSAIDQLIRLVQGGEVALLPVLTQLSLVVLLASATQWLASWSTNKLTYLVTRDLRDASHAKVANLPLSYIDTHSQGDLLSRVVNDVDQLGDGLQQGLTQFLTGVVTIIGTLCFMFYMSIPMGLVVALATPLSIIVASVITKYASSSFSKQQGYQGQLGGYAEEMVSNQELITAFAHKNAIIEQFEAINEKLRVVGERAQFASSLSNPSTRLVNNFIYALVAGLGCICVLTGVPSPLTIGQVQSFLSYANQYMKPFNAISAVVTQVQTAYASARRVFDLLDAKEIKPDPADAEVIQNPQGSIEFDDVAFSYDPKHPLLSHISFRAEPGQKIALVGPTGCGKTTLINLLLRFYSIDSGTRWEVLDALANLSAHFGDQVFKAFDAAEASLFDDDSATVRLAAFLFLCQYGATSAKHSDEAWPLLDEAVQCYHGDAEYHDMLQGLLALAHGTISKDVKKALSQRMKFDAENATGYIKQYSEEIVAATK